MNTPTDQQLLRQYAQDHCESAFAELVRRHVDLVYSVAWRMTGEAHLAEDVSQSVFVALAQDAARLADHPVLSGWLHSTARNLAAKTVRASVRRQAREQEAAAMNQLLSTGHDDAPWEQVAPQLDACLGELDSAERDAIVLRYFERKSAVEIGALLGVSDAAAQKRVSRAVDRLRELFVRRGVGISAGGLVGILSVHSIEAAPIGLAAGISAAVSAGSAMSATSAAVTTAKVVSMTILQKTVIGTTIALVAGVGVFETHQTSQLREKFQALQNQQPLLAAQIEQMQSDRDNALKRLAQSRPVVSQMTPSSNQDELVRLRGEVGSLRQQVQNSQSALRQQDQLVKAKVAEALEAHNQFIAKTTDTANAIKQIGLAMRIWAGDNNDLFPTNFADIKNELGATNDLRSFTLGGINLVDTFEMVNVGICTNFAQPELVSVRERSPRQSPDGTWSRAYIFADGSAQIATSTDGNFDSWEKTTTEARLADALRNAEVLDGANARKAQLRQSK